MGSWCWVKCQSCSRAVLIVKVRDHQSSPGRCIVTVWVLTCFINQSYWIARLLFLQPVTWPACQGPHILVSVYWPDALRQGTVRRARHYFFNTHIHTPGSTLCTPTHIPILCHGLSYLWYILCGLDTKQWHTTLLFFPYLSTSRAFITEEGNTG